MKTSPSFVSITLLLLFLFISPSISQNPNNLQLFLEPSSRTNLHHHHNHHSPHHHHHRTRFCDSFPSRYPPAICIQLESMSIRRHAPPLPLSSRPGSDEYDLRYGVEKRLVPGGPNPLHN